METKFELALSTGHKVVIDYTGIEWFDQPDLTVDGNIIDLWILEDLVVSLQALPITSVSILLVGIEFDLDMLSELRDKVNEIVRAYEETVREKED